MKWRPANATGSVLMKGGEGAVTEQHTKLLDCPLCPKAERVLKW